MTIQPHKPLPAQTAVLDLRTWPTAAINELVNDALEVKAERQGNANMIVDMNKLLEPYGYKGE